MEEPTDTHAFRHKPAEPVSRPCGRKDRVYDKEVSYMKRLKRLAGVLCTVFLLTGCAKVEIGYIVKSPSEVKVDGTVLYSPAISQNMNEENGNLSTSIDEETYENTKVENVEKEIDGEVWKGVHVTGDLKKDEVEKYLIEQYK